MSSNPVGVEWTNALSVAEEVLQNASMKGISGYEARRTCRGVTIETT